MTVVILERGKREGAGDREGKYRVFSFVAWFLK